MPFSTLHYREDPEYWRQWFPADFITESFPGQFRNWFYSMLAMSTVLRREPPFKTIFGYATLFAEDGRPMHKSSGNVIEFDEAADRMGVDVMRWMFAKSRPEDNILFGWHAADEARRELLDPVERLLVLRDVRPARRLDRGGGGATGRGTRRALDRWILSRAAGTAAAVEDRLARRRRGRGDPGAVRLHDGLSTWYLRLSRRRFSRSDDPRRSQAPRSPPCTRRSRRRPGCWRRSCRSSPRRCTATSRPTSPEAPDSVHLTRWPDRRPGRASRRAPGGARWRSPRRRWTWPGPCAARHGSRRASRWPRPGSPSRIGGLDVDAELLDIIATEINVKSVELIERRFGAHRAAGQAAAAEDRQAPRFGDPGGHGRRARGQRRPSRRTAP